MLDSAQKSSAFPCPAFVGDEDLARKNLVNGQLRPSGIRDERLLQAMGLLPRTCFVPPHLASVAYCDGPVKVAPDRFLLDPLMLARLIQAAEIQSFETVLDFAPATGYSSAVLASLAMQVLALEGDPDLAAQLRANVERLQMQNVNFAEEHEARGWALLKNCSVVLINGAVETVPQALFEALEDGARALVPVSLEGEGDPTPFPLAEARLYVKRDGKISYRVLFEAETPRLSVFDRPRGFVF